MSRAPLVVGLTGGIASGKSAVARRFAALGIPIIDTDRIARDLVAPGTPALQEIVSAFGPAAVNKAGELKRGWLRKRIFEDPHSRRILESILHPGIRRVVEMQLGRVTTPYCIVVAPLLFEAGFEQIADRTLAVDAAEQTRIQRLIRRDGIGSEEAHAALAAQMSGAERLERSHDVIDNNGGPAELDPQVALLHERYLELARAGGAPDAL